MSKLNKEFQNLKPGDIVLVHYRNKYYAKVLEVEQRYYDQEDVDDHVAWTKQEDCKCGNDYCPKAGQRYGDLVTIEKLWEYDMTPTKRKHVTTYDEGWMTKVTKEMMMDRWSNALKSIEQME